MRAELAITVISGMLVAFGLLWPSHLVDPAARAALATLIAPCAIVTGGLLLASFERTRQLPQLLLLCAVLAVSLGDFMYFGAASVTGIRSLEFGAGPRLVSEVIVALAFAAAALSPNKSLAASRPQLVKLAIAGSVTVVALGAPLAQALGTGSVASVDASAVGLPTTSAAILGIAALALLTGARRTETGSGLLAGTCLLLAGANLQHLVMPTVANGWVTPRDGLRLGAYVLLLGTAYLQYAKLRHEETCDAICSERERIARDLHDGLAQDLACIAAQGQRLDCKLAPDHPLMLAARRAIAVSRGVIADLTASTAPTTEGALRLIAAELEHRFDLEVDVRIEADPPLDLSGELEPTQRENVIRIAREAIVNAARHGTAHHVDVVLVRRQGTLLMRVSDDGLGIADGVRSGFGLRTMQARAASLGGRLSTQRGSDGGTQLELLVS